MSEDRKRNLIAMGYIQFDSAAEEVIRFGRSPFQFRVEQYVNSETPMFEISIIKIIEDKYTGSRRLGAFSLNEDNIGTNIVRKKAMDWMIDLSSKGYGGIFNSTHRRRLEFDGVISSLGINPWSLARLLYSMKASETSPLLEEEHYFILQTRIELSQFYRDRKNALFMFCITKQYDGKLLSAYLCTMNFQ